jgi:hypothetical protein
MSVSILIRPRAEVHSRIQPPSGGRRNEALGVLQKFR